MSLNELLANIIESKYAELGLTQPDEGIFHKIKFFEGNAIGQIGLGRYEGNSQTG